MNKSIDEANRGMMKEVIKSLESKTFAVMAIENALQKKERETKEAYSKYKHNIPWYLIPFKAKISEMLYQSFKDGKAEYDKEDTVTIKRPSEYKTKRTE